MVYRLIIRDERLTTVAAERMLVEQADVSRNKRKKVIDKLAAATDFTELSGSKFFLEKNEGDTSMTHDHNHDHEHEERGVITLVDEQGNRNFI